MSICWRVSEREHPEKCHFLYFLERPLQQFCTTVQTVMNMHYITSVIICSSETRDSEIMWLCARITLCIIHDHLHNWIKCTQSSNLHMIRLFHKWNFAVQCHKSWSVTTSVDLAFLYIISYWHHSISVRLQKCRTCLGYCTGTWMLKSVM